MTSKRLDPAAGAEIGVGFGAPETAGTPESPGKALLRLTPADVIEPPVAPRRRAAATFVAQLIATDQQLPQTRERRRAEPQEAKAAYDAVARIVRTR